MYHIYKKKTHNIFKLIKTNYFAEKMMQIEANANNKMYRMVLNQIGNYSVYKERQLTSMMTTLEKLLAKKVFSKLKARPLGMLLSRKKSREEQHVEEVTINLQIIKDNNLINKNLPNKGT